MTFRRSLTFLFFALSLSWLASAQADDLQVGLYPFAPYFIISENGEMSGPWKDILDQKLKSQGYTPVYSHYPPPRLAKNIIQGKTNVTISAHHVAVDNHVFYSERPVDKIILNAYHKPDRPTVKTIADLKGKSVIVIRGYAYNGRIKALRDPANDITLIDAVSHVEAIKRLQNGKADYLLDYKKPVESAFKETGIEPHQFVINELSNYPVYFVVSHKTKNAKEIIEKLNASLSDKF